MHPAAGGSIYGTLTETVAAVSVSVSAKTSEALCSYHFSYGGVTKCIGLPLNHKYEFKIRNFWKFVI